MALLPPAYLLSVIVTPPERRYSEPDADNDRWDGFAFRDDDIVISAPSKSGTTWTQLLVALLVFDGPEFPAPLSRLSPWMDQKIRSRADVHEMFDAQTHRRFIKTHTPLDGIPYSDQLTYVCVGRDPRDAAVSMIHHGANMVRDRFHELIAAQQEEPVPEPEERPEFVESDYFDRFIDSDDDEPDWTLRFLSHHYRTFWEHRQAANVDLFHFSDYLRDLPSEIVRLGSHLGVTVDDRRAKELAEEAAIERIRGRAGDVAPEAHVGLWKDTSAFFRSGSAGEWRERMSIEQQDRYTRRSAELMPPGLARWVHHGRLG